MGKYTDEQYLEADIFDDGEADIRLYRKKIVITRKEFPCAASDVVPDGKRHSIAIGSRAIRETANVDGKYGSAYSCLNCLGKWLDMISA